MKTVCMKKIAIFLMLTGFCTGAFAEEFMFKYTAGDNYRILSTVQEDVYFNGMFSHHAEIVNRIGVEVTGASGDWGNHDAIFMTSEASTDQLGMPYFTWGEEYRSIFNRSVFGEYDIGDAYFMPVVRNVPVFPAKDLKPGDTWTADGEEAHDLRRGFDMPSPFKVPFTVKYKYIGPETVNGKTLHKISAQYTMDFTNRNIPVDRTMDYPYYTQGFSKQTIYFDNELGGIDHYSEEFRIIIVTAYGTEAVFEGTAKAEVTSQNKAVKETKIEEVAEKIKDLGIENTEVTETDKGITISIENIQFKADSAFLMDSEKLKLRKIATILQQYPDNDLLVSGHTALAGSEKARQELSEKRAQAVAAYLVELGIKDAYHIFSKGFGAEQPIAENTTEAGRARNRRVEITILK